MRGGFRIAMLGAAVVASMLAPPVPARAETKADTAQALARSAEVMAREGSLDEAARLYQRAWELDPDPVLLYNVALLLDRKGDVRKAREAYLRYIQVEKDPDGKARAKVKLDALPTKTTGQIVLAIEPPGGTVEVDNRPVTTPMDAPLEVESGPHVVTLRHDGYVTERVSTEVAIGKPSRIVLRMEPDKRCMPAVPSPCPPGGCFLDVLYKPAGAEVELDGRVVGHTPLEAFRVAPGRYVVRLLKPDFLPKTLKLAVAGDQQLDGDLDVDVELLQRRDTERMLATDYIRLQLLAVTNGLGGVRLSTGGVKWPGFFWNILQVGWSGGLEGWEAYAGGDLGYLWIHGNHFINAGMILRAQWNMYDWDPDTCPDGAVCNTDAGKVREYLVGFAFGPVLRYRYYVDRVGFEAFMEIPIVVGYGKEHDHWGGGYPIFGVGIGM